LRADEADWNSGEDVRKAQHMATDAHHRRKRFRSEAHRAEFGMFEAGRLYHADFFNPYIDFSSFSLTLPGGFQLHCLKYIGDKTHKLRYVFKDSEDPEKVYFCVVFTLLHGKDLEHALKEEEEKNPTKEDEKKSADVETSEVD
jgi:hypothetical protein